MPRKLLVFAALAVAGSMLVLWLVTRDTAAEETSGGDDDATTVADSRADRTSERTRRPALPDQPSGVTTTGEPTAVATPGQPRTTDPDRPLSATVESTERGSQPGPPREPLEYTLPDGRRVRDFRDPSKRKPLDLPPSIHAPGGRKIKPELTGLFTDQMLAHMRACKQAVPASALGTKPRLEGQIVIAIKSEQASVTSAVFMLTGISDSAVAQQAKQCVEQAALTVKVPAQGETDLDAYSINLSLAFR
jgi:hypothetical protein